MSKPKASPIKASRRTFPVEVLWCGNLRQGSGKGWSFPPNVEKFLRAECEGKTVLHPFGGRSRFGTRMDIDPFVRPDVLADAWLPPYGKDSFDVVILDPPYIHLNAQVKTALFRQYIWIAKEKLVWFHTIWMSNYGGVSTEKGYLVRVGDNCHVRCLQFFKPKGGKKLPPVNRYTRGPGMIYNRWKAQPEVLPFEGSTLQFSGKPAPEFTPSFVENLERLVCPLCRKKVAVVDEDAIKCLRCRRTYPIVDGIPNMLIAEALPVAQETA